MQGSPVTPAAAYIEQGLAAADQMFGPGPHVIENLVIQQAMFLPEGAGRLVQVAVSPESGGQCSFETYSIPGDAADAKPSWTLHALGRLAPAKIETSETSGEPRRIDLEDVRAGRGRGHSRSVLRAGEAPRPGVWPGVSGARRPLPHRPRCPGGRGAAGSVAAELKQYHLHPALLDGCLQTVAGIVPLETDGGYSPYTYMPVGVRRMAFHAPLTEKMFTYAVRTSDDNRPSPEAVEGDVFILDETGRVLVELSGVRVQRLGRAGQDAQKLESIRDWLYRIHWRQQPLPDAAETNGRAAAAKPGTWLIFADRTGVAEALATQLRERHGQEAILVRADESFDPLSADDYHRALGDAFTLANVSGERGHRPPDGSRTCAGVIHLWSLDIPARRRGQCHAPRHASPGRRQRAVSSCASWPAASISTVRRTCGSSPAAPQDLSGAAEEMESIAVGQSPLWGLGRVASIEHPELKCRLIDLDSAATVGDAADSLTQELAAAQSKFRRVERREPNRRTAPASATWLVWPRCRRASPSDDAGGLELPAHGAYQLRVGKTTSIENLNFASFTRQPPAAGQVEMEVHAAGLNFSDVLKALGLYPGNRGQIVPLGIEASGVVGASAKASTRFKVGDEVFGVAPYSFASHARTADYALVHRPPTISRRSGLHDSDHVPHRLLRPGAAGPTCSRASGC